MPVELKEKYPFSVDTWTTLSKKKRHHFLTHAHSDHTHGIESHVSWRIYCSDMTRKLVCRRFPKLQFSQFIVLNVGEAKSIGDDESHFTVTALDANHCPGAVMFLFEGSFGNVLHTGDCRLDESCLKDVLGKYKAGHCVLDCIFLDCTFGKERLRMPSKEEAFLQVQDCILNHPKAPIVFLACDLLGQEELLESIVKSFRSKIFVDLRTLPECIADMVIIAPHLLTGDAESTRFHICEGFPKLYERAKEKLMEAHMNHRPEPLFIRPSAQWYVYEGRLEGSGSGLLLNSPLNTTYARRKHLRVPQMAEKDQFGIWHVCYSMHSSKWELERALEILSPKVVISTTPICKACDLSLPKSIHCHTFDVQKPVCLLNNQLSVRSDRSTFERMASDTIIDKYGEDKSRSLVAVFGMSRHSIPSSPPVSYTSSDGTHLDSHLLSDGDSPALEEVVQTPVKTEKAAFLSTSATTFDREVVQVSNEIVNVSCILKTSPVKKMHKSLGESSRKVYRSLYLPIPSSLPSLDEMFNFP